MSRGSGVQGFVAYGLCGVYLYDLGFRKSGVPGSAFAILVVLE